MHANRNNFRIYLLCLFVTLVNCEKNDSVFIPTREWQAVNKGIPIPSGLHIRHNFETGVTEAKLMDPDETVDKSTDKGTNDSQTKSLSVHPDAMLEKEDDDSGTTKEHVKFPVKELKARLSKIKQDAANALENLKRENAKSEPKKKFKSYETIKKELKDLEINVTNDIELLGNYFQKFQGHKDSIAAGSLTLVEIEDIMDILNNLEFLIHQIDNAQIFTKMEGMNKIISPCLNGTNDKIKAEALRLLGAAVQSNPKVQLKALENDFVKKLLHILSMSKKLDVKSRCLFALSALTRQFPAAQKAFVDHGGLEIFGNILSDDHLQIRMRVMRLINDLVKERQDLLEIAGVTPSEVKHREHKIIEYELTGFDEKLVLQKYCKHLSNLMIGSYKKELTNKLNSEDYEFLEVVYESMIALYPTCKSDFTIDKHVLLPVVNNMINFYETSGDDANTDQSDIFQHLLMLVRELRTIFETPHDEL